MNKPEILKGEVKEFIDYYKPLTLSEEPLDFIRRLMQIKNFYSQPFKPEMVEEYFEELPDKLFYFPSKSGKNYFINKKTRGYIPLPKTLSQFITNCIQAGIKLTWKGKE